MGGGAFRETKRLTRPELDNITSLVLDLLKSVGIDHCTSPPELADKTSFGDVDILAVIPDSQKSEVFAAIYDALGCSVPMIGNRDHEVHFCTKERFQVMSTFIYSQLSLSPYR